MSCTTENTSLWHFMPETTGCTTAEKTSRYFVAGLDLKFNASSINSSCRLSFHHIVTLFVVFCAGIWVGV